MIPGVAETHDALAALSTVPVTCLDHEQKIWMVTGREEVTKLLNNSHLNRVSTTESAKVQLLQDLRGPTHAAMRTHFVRDTLKLARSATFRGLLHAHTDMRIRELIRIVNDQPSADAIEFVCAPLAVDTVMLTLGLDPDADLRDQISQVLSAEHLPGRSRSLNDIQMLYNELSKSNLRARNLTLSGLANILNAGFHPPVAAMATLTAVVLSHLHNAPTKNPRKIINEVLRCYGPVGSVVLTPEEPILIRQQWIPENSTIIASLQASNLDPAHTAYPMTFDPDRPPTHHLAFSAGQHRCPGAALANVQLTTLLTSLIGNPGLRLCEPVTWKTDSMLLRPEAVRVNSWS